MGYRPSVHFFPFFLKTNLECNSYYKDKALETYFILAIPKSPISYYFELEATYIETVSLVK